MQLLRVVLSVIVAICTAWGMFGVIMRVMDVTQNDRETMKELREEKRREREDRKNLRFLSAWKWDILDGLIESGIIPADEDGFITQEYVKKYELFWAWARKNLIK